MKIRPCSPSDRVFVRVGSHRARSKLRRALGRETESFSTLDKNPRTQRAIKGEWHAVCRSELSKLVEHGGKMIQGISIARRVPDLLPHWKSAGRGRW